MDRCTDRWQTANSRIRDAGFKGNIHRVRGTDVTCEDIPDAWARHGSPPLDVTDYLFSEYPGKQACAIAHYDIWKHIIENEIQTAVVFEDDIGFHPDWHIHANKYWEETPSDFDILYMGSYFPPVRIAGICKEPDAVGKVNVLVDVGYTVDCTVFPKIMRKPIFCTHAYIITLVGAEKLYNLCVHNVYGTRTIDVMLMDYMLHWEMNNMNEVFRWYVWNASALNDVISQHKAITGLVYQDNMYETNISHL